MAVEQYRFEFYGASFHITCDNASPVTTTSPPNMRVIDGTWPTWRLEIDNQTHGIEGLRLIRCVGATSSTPHPAGNLTAAQSAANGSMVIATPDGVLYGVPNGVGALARMLTSAEWNDLRSGWENNLHNL